MQVQPELGQDLVFVGGGHAHALVLRMFAMRPVAGLRITLISPSSHTPYSGMLPGLVAGHYSFEQTHIDLARLCQWAGVRFIESEVIALDPQARVLTLRDRPAVSYDVLSIDIGSQPELDPIPGARQHSVPVKPVAGLWQRWQDLHGRVAASTGLSTRVTVVGGGAGSVELAMAIAHKLQGHELDMQLVCGAPQILQGYNRRARSRVERALREMGIELHLASRVTAVEPGILQLADGETLSFDELFWCTGASPASWLANSGLASDDKGFLAVHDTLQSVSDDAVFGAGDCATQLAHPRPKAGVYAVRQAPVLAHNLRQQLLRKPLRQHRPQARFLSLVSLGDRRAVADRGPVAASGAWVWRWKDRIDRKFMGLFEDLPVVMAASAESLPAMADSTLRPHCGGCGAKVAAAGLQRVLADLGEVFPEHCRPQDLGDDSCEIPTAGAQRIVQSIDVLRELVADPWLMGRIAANHALSDLYACGAEPVSALATVTLPFARPALLRRDLTQLMAGALHEFSQVGCRLTGGHSLQGVELNIGFVVNGVAGGADLQLLTKSGLRPGDQLLLTKPLGTGTLFASHMQLQADGRHIAGAVDMMLQSNAAAGRLALSHGASACTDVTGFGLAGHLLEMLTCDLAASLELDELPLLPGALAGIAAGNYSSMQQANSAARQQLKALGPVPAGPLELLFDPQTSGGLLIGIAADRAAELASRLRAAGYGEAAIIGEITTRDDPEAAALLVK